jgi:tRNA A-37 threonylcarbamoyl transferase component Bud32
VFPQNLHQFVLAMVLFHLNLGVCIGPNNCTCTSSLYNGINCDDRSNLIGLITPFICLFIICVALIIFVIMAAIGSVFLYFVILILQKDKKNKEVITKNKELQEKLLMINDLNKIPFNMIRFDKNKNKELIVLGKGATSVVYSGVYNAHKVAIKEVHDLEDNANSLISEIMLLKNIEHNNIVRYYGYSIDPKKNFFIVTELMNNGSLYSILKKLSLFEKYQVLIDVCNGMCFLHSRDNPIIHRDLKSQNILLNRDMVAKISDFGLSKIENLNATSSQKGTPTHQSPGK